MRKRLLAAGALIGSLLVLLATLLLIRGGILRSRERTAYRFSLRDAVYALDQGREADAAEHLRRAAENAHSPEAWLRLLKGARELDGRDLYAELLREGQEAFPASEPLSAAWGLQLLESGEASQAWELLSRRVDPKAYPALLSAALLAAEADPGDLATEELSLFAALPESDRSEPFLRAYEFTGALPFLENALLITLREGEFDTARTILGRFPDPTEVGPNTEGAEPGSSQRSRAEPFAESRGRLLLMAAHTLEESTAFYSYLRAVGGRAGTAPEPLLLQADLRMSAREFEEAQLLYEEVRTVAPTFSPVPFLNGGWLRRRAGVSSVELLRKGTTLFPESAQLETALLQELIYRGDEEAARTLIDSGEPTRMTKLLELAFFHAPDLDRGYTPRLWELLNEEENAPDVGRFLAYHLVGVNDLPELERLLGRFPSEEHSWARFYLGYLAFRRGSYEQADELFSRKPEEGSYPVPPWIWEGNGALAALYTGSTRRALEGARRARESFISRSPDRESEHLATLFTLEAEALRLSGRQSEAREVARRAVEIAPESNSARLLLRNLERPR
ncbi:MAG: hypothetical protein ACLFPW_05415 [Spirochaetaceae bacterium]